MVFGFCFIIYLFICEYSGFEFNYIKYGYNGFMYKKNFKVDFLCVLKYLYVNIDVLISICMNVFVFVKNIYKIIYF